MGMKRSCPISRESSVSESGSQSQSAFQPDKTDCDSDCDCDTEVYRFYCYFQSRPLNLESLR
jgi:hypothetical protein